MKSGGGVGWKGGEYKIHSSQKRGKEIKIGHLCPRHGRCSPWLSIFSIDQETLFLYIKKWREFCNFRFLFPSWSEWRSPSIPFEGNLALDLDSELLAQPGWVVRITPHICHFFTRAKFLESKIYTEKRQFFRVKSVKNATFLRKICRKCQFFALNL